MTLPPATVGTIELPHLGTITLHLQVPPEMTSHRVPSGHAAEEQPPGLGAAPSLPWLGPGWGLAVDEALSTHLWGQGLLRGKRQEGCGGIRFVFVG